jgi:hypothetical protein
MMRWFEQHRMEWIADALYVYGFINRDHLVRKFGISVPQASHDLQQFQRLHPQVQYDKSAKRYVIAKQTPSSLRSDK